LTGARDARRARAGMADRPAVPLTLRDLESCAAPVRITRLDAALATAPAGLRAVQAPEQDVVIPETAPFRYPNGSVNPGKLHRSGTRMGV